MKRLAEYSVHLPANQHPVAMTSVATMNTQPIGSPRMCGEYVHRNIKEIIVKTHGHKAKSIFRYGLDIVTEFLVRERNDRGIPILTFLSFDNPLINIPIDILEHIENHLYDAAGGM